MGCGVTRRQTKVATEVSGEPDCKDCVYDSVSDCVLCADCGLNSRRVSYPDTDQAANEREIAGLKADITAQTEHIVELEAACVTQHEMQEQVCTLLDRLEPKIARVGNGSRELIAALERSSDENTKGAIIVAAAKAWRAPVNSYAIRKALDDALTAAVDAAFWGR